VKSWQHALLLVSIGTATACGGDDPPPETPAAPPPSAEEPAPAPQAVSVKSDEGTSGTLNISPDIRSACGITDPEAFFAFNSSIVRRGDAPVLDKLAQCFTTGPLAGRKMRLVGHADPRGEDSYNLALGERRASGVKKYLVNAGLGDGQSDVTSRGEMDATGADETGWGKDRRVDVVLAD
jgi:peptidoglycan-associated lipoprotein